MRNLYILLFVLLSFGAIAQIPGYMGRRILLSANISPNVILPVNGDFSYVGNTPRLSGFKVRPRFGGSLDYVVTRNMSLGVKYSFVQFGVEVPRYFKDVWGDIENAGTTTGLVKCHSIGLRITGYGRTSTNLPAPLGFFGGYQLGVGIGQFTDTQGVFTRPNGKKAKGVYATNVHPDVIVFVGMRRGIGKRMLWSFLTEFNFSYLGYWLASDDWYYKHPKSEIVGTSDVGKQQYQDNKFAARGAYYNANLFNLTLEFTFLPR